MTIPQGSGFSLSVAVVRYYASSRDPLTNLADIILRLAVVATASLALPTPVQLCERLDALISAVTDKNSPSSQHKRQ